jgi:hypothetical protein
VSSLRTCGSVESHNVAKKLNLAIVTLADQAKALTELSRDAVEETGGDGRLSKHSPALRVEEAKCRHTVPSHTRPHTIGTNKQLGPLSCITDELDIQEVISCGAVAFEPHVKADMLAHT